MNDDHTASIATVLCVRGMALLSSDFRLASELCYLCTITTNLAACVSVCVSVQNLTNFCPYTLSFRLQTSRKFCSHSKIPIRCLWTASCVPLSFICYEKQSFRMQIVTLRHSRVILKPRHNSAQQRTTAMF